MSKAIEGAAMLGGALAMGVAAFLDPALIASPFYLKAMEMLVLGGISMEAGAIAGALTGNRGMGITSRQPAAFRQIIYGEQRIGGTTVYQSTTGSSHDQYNFIIVLAGHEIDSIVNLYLDGRQVYWQGSGAGWTVRNGVGFGGVADGNTHTGPDGLQYNFGGTGHSGIYCEARFGDQAPGDVIGGMTANDPNWGASASGSPYLGGCAYVYLKIEYNPVLFPSVPEIRFTVRGRNRILDPRTGLRGYTMNWALIVADILTDTQYGLGDAGSVNTAQLIAAANVCDEQVAVAATGGTEARYATAIHYDASVDPMNAINRLMPAAGGRLSRVGGEWFIWPAYWQGPSFTFDHNSLTATPSWTPFRSMAELCNRVQGTYIAPNYPYNTAGNLYDSNGFYNGQIQNNFPFAFQPTSFPQYAEDALHGFPSDEYLNQDSGLTGPWDAGRSYATGEVALEAGVLYISETDGNLGNTPAAGSTVWTPWQNILPKELTLETVLSVTQAQRLAKIALRRNRQQGAGTFRMSLAALQMQPTDVMQFTFPMFGWVEKTLEIGSVKFWVEAIDREDGSTAMAVLVEMGVAETDASVYEWDPATDELTVYDVPASPQQQPRNVAPPTGVSLTSSAATAVVGVDGIVRPRVEIQWSTPADARVTSLQIQYRSNPQGGTVGTWLDAGSADVSSNLFFIGDVVAGSRYDFRIRAVRGYRGATSAWVELDAYTVSLTLSVERQLALAPGSLIGEAFSTGTAAVEPANGVGSFVAVIGNVSVPVAPGNYPLAGLNQGESYDVYYIDPTFAGGAVTAIPTQNATDYLNKLGYYLIDTVVTPIYGSGASGTGGRYVPSASSDTGTRGTQTAAAAYDGDVTTAAVVSGTYRSTGTSTGTGAIGQCTWAGFPALALPADGLLRVTAAAVAAAGNAIPYTLAANVGGAITTLLSDSVSSGATDYTLAIAAGQNLADVSITATVDGPQDDQADSTTAFSHTALLKIYEISIQ